MASEIQLDQWEERVRKLNSVPEYRLFEVGPKGTMCAGDPVQAKDKNFEAQIKSVRPGIWHLQVKSITYTLEDGRPLQSFGQALAKWVAPGPLNVEDLENPYPGSDLKQLSPWKIVGEFTVTTGAGAVLDQDGLDAFVSAKGGDGSRQYVLEKCSEFGEEYKARCLGVSVQIGFLARGGEGECIIKGRKHEGEIVELLLAYNRGDEEDEAYFLDE